jgi:hypothetical protein
MDHVGDVFMLGGVHGQVDHQKNSHPLCAGYTQLSRPRLPACTHAHALVQRPTTRAISRHLFE